MARRKGSRPRAGSPLSGDHSGTPLVELQERRSTTPLSGTARHSSEDAVRSETGSVLASPPQVPKSDPARSQPVELDANPPPQVEAGTAPEALIPIPDIGRQEPGRQTGGQDVGKDAHWSQRTLPPPGPWQRFVQHLRKRAVRVPFWAWATMAIIGLAVVVIIVFCTAQSVKNSHSTSPSPKPATTTTAALTSPTSTSTSTPLPGCGLSTYASGVDWVGISNGQGWQFHVSSAGSDVNCCDACASDTAGCNAWLYTPDDGGATDCSIIVGYAGPSAGRQCPQGKPDIEFHYVSGKPNNAGGPGPCAGSVQG